MFWTLCRTLPPTLPPGFTRESGFRQDDSGFRKADSRFRQENSGFRRKPPPNPPARLPVPGRSRENVIRYMLSPRLPLPGSREKAGELETCPRSYGSSSHSDVIETPGSGQTHERFWEEVKQKRTQPQNNHTPLACHEPPFKSQEK